MFCTLNNKCVAYSNGGQGNITQTEAAHKRSALSASLLQCTPDLAHSRQYFAHTCLPP